MVVVLLSVFWRLFVCRQAVFFGPLCCLSVPSVVRRLVVATSLCKSLAPLVVWRPFLVCSSWFVFCGSWFVVPRGLWYLVVRSCRFCPCCIACVGVVVLFVGLL